ncbi:MAG TPA: GNAT family N-acetyltransferase [Stellaceae bacterium]|nr:GNAT family N-acetyltransferase [Stellaceae bacterium]
MSITARESIENGRRMAPVRRRSPSGAIDVVPPAAEPIILALNNAHAMELSWLDPARLSLLLRQAFYVRRIGAADAFLLALDQRAQYDSPNYQWFRERYPRFVYVDRIVVAPAARGQGLARWLYADLFRHVAAAGHDTVLCEINLDPPNPASDALHGSLGFAEVGRAAIHGGAKTVRYFARTMRG